MSNLNRLTIAGNPFQGKYFRVLCVCSGGVLRSPTTAWVLGQAPYLYNTRAAGTDQHIALIPVEETLLFWSEEIVCMEKSHKHSLEKLLNRHNLDRPVICLDIPDSFAYRDPELVKLIQNRYAERKPV